MRFLAIAGGVALSATMLMADTAQERLQDSTAVFSEIMTTPARGIPQDLLAKASCVVIIPGMKKGAFIVGAQYGRGFAECRRPEGRRGWGPPAAVRLEGGSFGLQIGGSSTDIVMLVMNQSGMNRLMSDKFTIGGDASAAAGPVGRTTAAETDVELHAEMLTWSRARGVFAGISLNGSTMRPDQDVNAELYGHKMSNRELLTSNLEPPASARPLIAELDKYSIRKEGSGTAARER
jgi:SH3 domain-containing YSC84-like protein 1